MSPLCTVLGVHSACSTACQSLAQTAHKSPDNICRALLQAGDFRAPPHPFRWIVAHHSTVLYDHEAEAVVYDMLSIDDPLLRSHYLGDVQTISGGLNHRWGQLACIHIC